LPTVLSRKITISTEGITQVSQRGPRVATLYVSNGPEGVVVSLAYEGQPGPEEAMLKVKPFHPEEGGGELSGGEVLVSGPGLHGDTHVTHLPPRDGWKKR